MAGIQDPSIQLISCDQNIQNNQTTSWIAEIKRKHFSGDAKVESERNFGLSLSDKIIRYLYGQISTSPGKLIVCDSYYYKLLAKCILHGLSDESLFKSWRDLPQLGHVIFIDVSPRSAWLRCEQGTLSNHTEYYGPLSTRANFELFQADLREQLLAETSHLPRTIIQGDKCIGEVIEEAHQLIADFAQSLSSEPNCPDR